MVLIIEKIYFFIIKLFVAYKYYTLQHLRRQFGGLPLYPEQYMARDWYTV